MFSQKTKYAASSPLGLVGIDPVQTEFAFGEKVTLNGSGTAEQTFFNGTGLLSNGRADTLAMAFGLTLSDALADGDKLSLALARPLAVSGVQVT